MGYSVNSKLHVSYQDSCGSGIWATALKRMFVVSYFTLLLLVLYVSAIGCVCVFSVPVMSFVLNILGIVCLLHFFFCCCCVLLLIRIVS